MFLIGQILKILVLMSVTTLWSQHLNRPRFYKNTNKEAVMQVEKTKNKRKRK